MITHIKGSYDPASFIDWLMARLDDNDERVKYLENSEIDHPSIACDLDDWVINRYLPDKIDMSLLHDRVELIEVTKVNESNITLLLLIDNEEDIGYITESLQNES